MNKNKIEILKEKVASLKKFCNNELQTIIDKRMDYVDNRSEKWQESEKGEYYVEQTYELEGLIDDLDCIFFEAEEKLDEIIEL